jgi:hypothetical protein
MGEGGREMRGDIEENGHQMVHAYRDAEKGQYRIVSSSTVVTA